MPHPEHEHRPDTESPYWGDNISLFDGTFRLTRNEPTPIRARVHRSDEPYARHRDGPEITRTYLRLQPYLALPNLKGILDLAPGGDGRVGTLAGSGFAPDTMQPIGDAQAWHYPADRTLVLWECFLDERYRDMPLAGDANMTALWRGMEGYLASRFPDAARIITPPDDPLFDDDEYREFLRARGFAPLSHRAFGKDLVRE